ncbi:MAG TPA: transposase [Salinivirga sp.]|uniref:transposase n=1 Tax=Salinivirga sp. TaxID=1970192 RepID=UPI002B4804DD|nr:transposase [Salinivirga sp.]HKK59313.1 transposase [Salinivirga sp.]
MARIFSLKPKTLYHWYRNYLSAYNPDKDSGVWHPKYLENIDMETGEITKGKPLYVFKPENIGERMSIDDKAIGHEGFTILSNADTGKIAMMVESCKSAEVGDAISQFGTDLQKVKNISCDMAASYLLVCSEELPQAKVVIDKFHVMQYVYDAVLDVRRRIKKELSSNLSKGKVKTQQDKAILFQLDLLRQTRYRLTQSPHKWSDAGKEVMDSAFCNHPQLKTAYDLAQAFKKWYAIENIYIKNSQTITADLHRWYYNVNDTKLDEFRSVLKMIRKHENEILNFFICGQTNAKAERINGKINRFISNNYGMKDKDFALYRTALYFS